MRPRLLILTPDFPPRPGGINVMMHRLATLIETFDSEVVTRDQLGASAFDRELDVAVRRSRRSRWGTCDQALLNLTAVRVGIPLMPTVILNGHIATAPAAAMISKVCGAPICVYVHADEVVQWPHLASMAVRTSAATIAVSEHTKRLALERGANRTSLHLIHPGVDIPSQSRRTPRQRPTILTVARLEDRFKGHDVLIRSLPTVKSAVPDFEWVVVGDGSLRGELERSVADRDLTEHVRFLGTVDDGTRDRWLSSAHVFALPSRLDPGTGGEGFGIALVEAAAHGLPVVAGAAAGMLDAVDPGRTGLLVSPTDPDALARALISLLTHPAWAAEMGRAGLERARRFSWPRTVPKVEAVLSTIGRPGPIRPF